MAEPLVVLERAGRRYPRGEAAVPALAEASCAVFPGDRVALVGPSGSGKSTLLHLMAGLDAPTSGAVSWPALGPADGLRPGKVALIFQAPSLLPALTVAENVGLPLLLAGAAAGARAAALAALGRVGLAGLAEKLPEELSGGQAQRVAAARALVGSPALILADEPTGQLDRATGDRLLDQLLAALQPGRTALVIATHDPSVACRMRTVWRLDRGVLRVPGAEAGYAA